MENPFISNENKYLHNYYDMEFHVEFTHEFTQYVQFTWHEA